jgi:hypothetical protein
VALAGQQNAGKSTLFNVLTGARQHVTNYPGVTVDKKLGQYNDEQATVYTVDLPGTYSLTSFSLEERVAREPAGEPAAARPPCRNMSRCSVSHVPWERHPWHDDDAQRPGRPSRPEAAPTA